jgi:hypothetical protein
MASDCIGNFVLKKQFNLADFYGEKNYEVFWVNIFFSKGSRQSTNYSYEAVQISN